MPGYHPLLDLPPYPTDRYAPLADRLARWLGTVNDVVFVQAEAILALEATAASLARPGRVALNIVTSPYGRLFGTWLARAGATVHEVAAEPGRPITLDAVTAALAALPRVDLVSMVHAETSSGILNPLPEVSLAVRTRGALLVVDAVASFGGHPLSIDALGIDVCVTGPQKAIGGPAGLSVASISPRAWEAMSAAPALSGSSLSLLALKHNWLDRGRGVVPGMPSAIEFWALEAALDRVDAETLPALIARHARAAAAARTGLRALGVPLWIDDRAQASTLVTTTIVPDRIEVAALVAEARAAAAVLSPGVGPGAERLVRLDHTGANATIPRVLGTVLAYGAALHRRRVPVDLAAASAAILGA